MNPQVKDTTNYDLPTPEKFAGGSAHSADMPFSGSTHRQDSLNVPAVSAQSESTAGPQINSGADSAQFAEGTSDLSDDMQKEFVDRARKIVVETSGDPYSRAERLAGLRKNYQVRLGRRVDIDMPDKG